MDSNCASTTLRNICHSRDASRFFPSVIETHDIDKATPIIGVRTDKYDFFAALGSYYTFYLRLKKFIAGGAVGKELVMLVDSHILTTT